MWKTEILGGIWYKLLQVPNIKCMLTLVLWKGKVENLPLNVQMFFTLTEGENSICPSLVSGIK